MDDDKKVSLLYSPLGYSMLNSTYAAATTFFAFLGEWMILFITFSTALLFIPLTPAFTLHSTSASILKITAENNFTVTANLGVNFFVDNINPLGGSINYASFNASLFHRKQKLSTFSVPQETTTPLEAMFHNVTLSVDEWSDDHGASLCGFTYLDLWFSVDAARDNLQGHCGEVKFELCNSSASPSFLASCDVYSGLVHKVRLGMLLLLILLLLGAAPVPLLVEQFFCFES